MTPITFSVVMPVRTGAPWLPAALESIAAQTRRPIECVVVDDGSEDESCAIVEAWGRSQAVPLTLIRPPQTPVGVSEARNVGVRAARGSWIAFLDQDDVWASTRLEEQAAFIVEHPAVAVVGCLPRLWFDGVSPVPFFEAWVDMIAEVTARTNGILALDDLVSGCPFCLSGVSARRSALVAAGLFDRACPPISDWLMWARLSARYPLALLPRELVAYRVHRANQMFDVSAGPLGLTSAFLEMRSRLTAHLAQDLGLSTAHARRTIDDRIRAAASERGRDRRFHRAGSAEEH